MPQPKRAVTDETHSETKRQFMEVWPILKDQLIDLMRTHGMPEKVTTWFGENLSYNTIHGKLNRGLAVLETLQILHARPLSPDELFKGCVLGWCVEILQANFSVADDMMDGSLTRRDQPCWYRIPRVGQTATNDAFMLEASLYHLLKLYFRHEPCYVYILELFLETTLKTVTGQMIDLITAPGDEVDLNKFSMERHQHIVVYKTAYYSFYLPVALAMRYAGEYFQIQDDYLDCYGTPEQIGKVGTDVRDNKCSWIVNIALQRADKRQRKILDENYGRKDVDSEARVKVVFKELQIDAVYKEYEQETYERLLKLIDSVLEGVPNLKNEVKYEAMMSHTPVQSIGGGWRRTKWP